jgi:hypothetical protein
LSRINTFNLIKKIIMRSSTMRPNKERVINIVLFVGLMNEVRQRMAVERSRMIRKFPDDFAKVMKK